MAYASKRCYECGNIIVPNRLLEIIEYIKKEYALLVAEIQRLEQKLVEEFGHEW